VPLDRITLGLETFQIHPLYAQNSEYRRAHDETVRLGAKGFFVNRPVNMTNGLVNALKETSLPGQIERAGQASEHPNGIFAGYEELSAQRRAVLSLKKAKGLFPRRMVRENWHSTSSHYFSVDLSQAKGPRSGHDRLDSAQARFSEVSQIYVVPASSRAKREPSIQRRMLLRSLVLQRQQRLAHYSTIPTRRD
jgi:hypothetical protein